MEKDNVINLGSERLRKANKQRRVEIEITPDGDFLYPEDRVEITEAKALDIARDIIAIYPDEEALVDDFKMHENGQFQTLNELLSMPAASPGEIRTRTQRSRISQQEDAAASETRVLVAILQTYRKDPKFFYGTKLLATAEELIKRFPEKQRP